MTGKHLGWSLFATKLPSYKPANLLKRRLQHKYFSINMAKFLLNAFGGCFLKICLKSVRLHHEKRKRFLISFSGFFIDNLDRVHNVHMVRLFILVAMIYIYIYIYIYINTHFPVNAIARQPHPRSGNSQGQETFLAPSTDKQTHNYDTECSNHNPSPSTYIYIYIEEGICQNILNMGLL